MNIVDVILLVILGYGVYTGFKSGFLLSVISFLSFFVAIVAAINFSGTISVYFIERYPQHETIIPLVVFIALFVIVILLLSVLGRALKKVLDMTLLGGLDNLAGALFGLVKWAFFVSTVIWLFSLLGLNIAEDRSESSLLLPVLKPVAPIVFDWVAYIFPGIKSWLEPFRDLEFQDKDYFTTIF